MGYEPKDQKRIADIFTKSKGSDEKALQLARTMANRIGHSDKALRRARAAEDVNAHEMAYVFFARHFALLAVGM